MASKTKEHPESLDKIPEVKVHPDPSEGITDRDDFVSSMIHEVRHAETDRTTWLEAQTRWYKKRYGVRPLNLNFPFPNAPNTHIALTDEKIRKLKPNYLNLCFEGEPVVTFYPVGGTPLEVSQNAEIYMDWSLRFGMNRIPGRNYFESMVLTVDRMLEKGFGINKIIHEHLTQEALEIIDLENDIPDDVKIILADPNTTDEQLIQMLADHLGMDPTDEDDRERLDDALSQFKKGESILRIRIEEVTYSGPRVIAVDPRDLIVPTDTTDIEQARLIGHRMWLTKNDLRGAERSGKYQNVDEVLHPTSGAKTSPPSSLLTTLDTTKQSREGITQFLQGSELVEIWEIFTWYDLNSDGVAERVVLTVDPLTETVLRFIPFPYKHGRWPFVVFPFELNDDRWYSPRGIPEILDPYQTIVTNQENAKLARMIMANSLQFKYRLGAMNPGAMRFVPGQGIGLQRMEDLEELRIQNLDISFDTEMAKIRNLAEQLIGQPDLSMGSLQSPNERRTAFEVSEVVSLGKQMFSLDARMFKNALQKQYNQIFDLILQYGPDEMWVSVTQDEPLHLTREQIQGDFIIVPTGDFTLLSRTLEVQQLFGILQQALGDKSGAIDAYRVWQEYLAKVNPRIAKKVMRNPEEYQQFQQMLQQQQMLEVENKKAIAGRKQETLVLGGSNGVGGA